MRRSASPNNRDFKWLLSSLFGLGGAGAIAANAIDAKRGLALYFIGLFVGLAPVLATIVFAFVGLVVYVMWQIFN